MLFICTSLSVVRMPLKIDSPYDFDYAEILLFRARPSTAKIAISPPYLTQNKNNEWASHTDERETSHQNYLSSIHGPTKTRTGQVQVGTLIDFLCSAYPTTSWVSCFVRSSPGIVVAVYIFIATLCNTPRSGSTSHASSKCMIRSKI